MNFSFVADRIVRDKAYPALAKWSAEPYTESWRQFAHHWPRTVPCELHEHCATHSFPYTLQTTRQPYNICDFYFYTIGLGFFDFDIDYFSMLEPNVLEEVRSQDLRVLFYYHEGDNPYSIKQRLDSLCYQHQLSTDCYRFVSGNTAANNIDNFVWFPDHELLYWKRNQNVLPSEIHTQHRSCEFTVLSRTHKWWRATVMADLHRDNLLDNSYWSYNTEIDINDKIEDNPIEIDTLNLREYVDKFLSGGPYSADQLTADQHNDHSIIESTHYTNSYCNIVLETHFDADQSGGAFLTEKIFKAIKHGQPFVIVGAPGSLQALRDLGYRTFDHAIDNSYDHELDNTQRWLKIKSTIQKIKKQDMHFWFLQCLDDIKHNQQLFLSSKYNRLNMLLTKLNSTI
jgi:hypothetical protein